VGGAGTVPLVGSAAVEGLAPEQSLVGTPTDLGTLGGPASAATAVDGSIVVGWATPSRGFEHAFAYDMSAAHPRMRDLGTLGGGYSAAWAVDDGVVVGDSETRRGAVHAFAYDLNAASPVMRDLGTLGGEVSLARKVSGHLVVGWADTEQADQHAFVYDLGAALPKMNDLGPVGTGIGSANAVDGTLVVGTTSALPSKQERAFAYDVSAAGPFVGDLGTLPGGTRSDAVAVDGSVVVGSSDDARHRTRAFAVDLAGDAAMRDLGGLGHGPSRATAVRGHTVFGEAMGADRRMTSFAYDLTSSHPVMRDIGNLGGRTIHPSDVDGGLLVGSATRAGDLASRVVVWDLAAVVPSAVDLGPGFDFDGESWVGVSGDVVASSRAVRGSPHAVIWRVSRTAGPTLSFELANQVVEENARSAVVTVRRSGDAASAVDVRYSTKGVSAVAGRDFTATTGTVSFAAGETRRSFRVPVLDDRKSERRETVLVTLAHPTGAGVLGTPRAAGLHIRPSDQRPDLWVGRRPTSRFLGNDVRNRTGLHQTAGATAHRGGTRSFYVRLYNDGNVTSTMALTGTAAGPGSRVRYLRGGTDVTAAMTSPTGMSLRLRPHRHRQVRLEIHVRSRAARGSLLPAQVTATWTGDGTRTDVVKARVRVVR
jgi:probable HAF family extracellular repeat protein